MNESDVLPSAGELSADSAPAPIDPQDAMRRKLSAIYQQVADEHELEAPQATMLQDELRVDVDQSVTIDITRNSEQHDCMVFVNGFLMHPSEYTYDGTCRVQFDEPLRCGDTVTVRRTLQQQAPAEAREESPEQQKDLNVKKDKRRLTTSKMINDVLQMYQDRHPITHIQDKLGMSAGSVYSILKGELLKMTRAQKQLAEKVYGNKTPTAAKSASPTKITAGEKTVMKKMPTQPVPEDKIKQVVSSYEERIAQLESDNRRLRAANATLMLRG